MRHSSNGYLFIEYANQSIVVVCWRDIIDDIYDFKTLHLNSEIQHGMETKNLSSNSYFFISPFCFHLCLAQSEKKKFNRKRHLDQSCLEPSVALGQISCVDVQKEVKTILFVQCSSSGFPCHTIRTTNDLNVTFANFE